MKKWGMIKKNRNQKKNYFLLSQKKAWKRLKKDSFASALREKKNFCGFQVEAHNKIHFQWYSCTEEQKKIF